MSWVNHSRLLFNSSRFTSKSTAIQQRIFTKVNVLVGLAFEREILLRYLAVLDEDAYVPAIKQINDIDIIYSAAGKRSPTLVNSFLYPILHQALQSCIFLDYNKEMMSSFPGVAIVTGAASGTTQTYLSLQLLTKT